MTAKIDDILKSKSSDIIKVLPDDSLYTAIQEMVNHNIGSVLVVSKEEELVGIITERDILEQCLRRSDRLKTTLVESVMTTDLIIGLLSDTLDYLIGVMTTNKIRHVPILSDGKILGIVSIGDLLKSQMKAVEYENRYLKDYISGKYPA
jgi:CBS domain-containing protein